MKKKNFIVFVLLALFFNLFLLTNPCAAQDKKKILVLHIIEENWDDLEFYLPKYDMAVGTGPAPVTKKQALKYSQEKMNTIRLQIKDKNERTKIKNNIKLSISKSIGEGDLSKDIKMSVNHKIKYYGKTYLLNDEDTFMLDSFRWDDRHTYFGYSYDKIPEKILILLEPKVFFVDYSKYVPPSWDKFEEIRLLDDIYILSYDKEGNLKIKYDGKEYNLKTDSTLELPEKEKNLTRNEMVKFREKYYEYYAKEYGWVGDPEGNFRSQLFQITSPKDIFHFGTKVTLINFGYVELE